MFKSLSLGMAFAALTATVCGAGTLPVQRVAISQRPVHAVLRYDSSTAASCKSFSDTSSEICLLLALHVIRMSQKPVAGAPL